MNTTATILNAESILKGPLGASPLARPFKRLAEDLNGLLGDGHLQSVELDLTHRDCPYFLLRVAADKPQFYVELFRGDLDDAFVDGEEVDGEVVPLCVLMNWMDCETEPAFWETEWETDCGEEPDFGEVLSHILSMTETRQTESQEAATPPTMPDTVIK